MTSTRTGIFDRARRREDDGGREERFKVKAATQNFLRNYTPLLVALVRGGKGLGAGLRSKEFHDDVRASRAVAAAVTAAVAGSEKEVTPALARNVRSEAVTLVASCRERGMSVDADAVARAVVDALSLSDGDFDAETMKWREMSVRGSSALTASHAAMLLWRVTGEYDFRLGQAVVLGCCMRSVTRLAEDSVTTILGPLATAEDRRSLMQSVMRDMASMLSARYESTARRTVRAILDLPLEVRGGYLRDERPFETMLSEFEAEATAYLDYAAKATNAIVAAEVAHDRRDDFRGR